MKRSKSDYSAKDIRALTDREHLLQRMALTFGPREGLGETYSKQKTVAFRELIDNSVDENLRGYATKVGLKFFADRSVEISDNGRGLPVDNGTNAQGEEVSGIILCLGTLKAGSNFDNSNSFSTGMNGVGASSTVMVSRRASVKVYRNNKEYSLDFKDGDPGFFTDKDEPSPDNPFTPLTNLTDVKVSKDPRPAKERKANPSGTTIRVWINEELFDSQYSYSSEQLIERFKKTCYLIPGIRGEVYSELDPVVDEDGNKKPLNAVYEFDDGLRQLVYDIQPDEPLFDQAALIEGKTTYSAKVGGQTIEKPIEVSVAFSYGDQYEHTIESFVNTIHTKLGGVHETALERAMRDVFNDKIVPSRLVKRSDEPPAIDDYKEGLTVVLSVKTPEPTFTSQSKEALSGSEVQKALVGLLTKELSRWANSKENADRLDLLCRKVSLASHNRQKSRAQRELDRKKNKLTSAPVPESLLECEAYGTEDAELYICEGDSAAGSLKQARDGNIHAILAIRGKFTNAYKATEAQLLENNDVQNIIMSIGGGSGKDFDIEKMAVGRVVIAVDADSDGNSISTLIFVLLHTLMYDLVKAGKLYKVETPLFVVSTKEGRKSRKLYAQDEQERDDIMQDLDSQGIDYTISRLKGLGEVPAEILEETAFNPDTRVLTKITLKDDESLDSTLELLFGKDTEERKQWIATFQGTRGQGSLDAV